jgi:hypothetical protein
MKTTIYWTCRHIQRAAQDVRFAAKLWWLNQQVEFLDWRAQMEALLPSLSFSPAPQPVTQGGRHALSSLYSLHAHQQ